MWLTNGEKEMKKKNCDTTTKLCIALFILLCIPVPYIYKLIFICICVVTYCIGRIVQALIWEHKTKKLRAFYDAENKKFHKKKDFFNTYESFSNNL